MMQSVSSGHSRYLSTQYLANSSLSEDIQQFDFSGGVQQFSASMDQSYSQKNAMPYVRKQYSDKVWTKISLISPISDDITLYYIVSDLTHQLIGRALGLV